MKQRNPVWVILVFLVILALAGAGVPGCGYDGTPAGTLITDVPDGSVGGSSTTT